jgi:hypothetical protein
MRMIIIMILVAVLAGCTNSTQYGDCVGIVDERDPNLVYKLSAQNMAVAIIFFELIAPPVIVLADELYCPVGVK